MPRPFKIAALFAIVLALIPVALIARARAVTSSQPRIHFVLDMDNQPKYRAQHPNELFADGRAMRPPVQGTISRGHLDDDEHFVKGVVGAQFANTFPSQLKIDMALMRHGQERVNIFCQPCHGLAGYGDGIINKRATELMSRGINGTTWVAPKSIHDAAILEQPVGQLFSTITNGVRTMPAYGPQIPEADRWAIVAYIRALQLSQNITPSQIPAEENLNVRTLEFPSSAEEPATQPQTAPAP